MKYYHGSKSNIENLERRQAHGAAGVNIPENELLNAIYLTTDYGFALACAVRPKGVTHISHDKKRITFEHPELFEPDREVFVYEISETEIEKISKEKIVKCDDGIQIAVTDTKELPIFHKDIHKARDVEQYYELANWKEKVVDIHPEFKIK